MLTGGCIVFEVVFDTVVVEEADIAASGLAAVVVTVLEDLDSTEDPTVVDVAAVDIAGFSVLIAAYHLSNRLLELSNL